MWGISGPYVVELIWSEKMRCSLTVFDTQREAQVFAQKFRSRSDVYSVRAWDMTGSWQE